MDYPSTPCEDHPSRMWEWDGYCWVCPSCVLDHPKESKPNVVSDECEDCGQTIWYDANDGVLSTYCDDEDLAVEHDCDPDEWEDE